MKISWFEALQLGAEFHSSGVRYRGTGVTLDLQFRWVITRRNTGSPPHEFIQVLAARSSYFQFFNPPSVDRSVNHAHIACVDAAACGGGRLMNHSRVVRASITSQANETFPIFRCRWFPLHSSWTHYAGLTIWIGYGVIVEWGI